MTTRINLKAGEGVFCNSNMLHTGRRAGSSDCTYLSVTVNPSLLYGYEASLIQTKYIQPVTKNPLFPSVPFTEGEAWGKEVLLYMQQIWQLYQEPTSDYELELLSVCTRSGASLPPSGFFPAALFE